MIDSTHVKAHRSASGGRGSRSRLLAVRAEGATRRFTHSQMLKGAHRHPAELEAKHTIVPWRGGSSAEARPSKHMLGDKAYDSAELRDELDERGTRPVIPNRSNRKATVQLQQAALQASLAHRECLQQVEGLQAHRHPIRQTGTKLSRLCLSGRCSCMVDLMSLDPSSAPSRYNGADRG